MLQKVVTSTLLFLVLIVGCASNSGAKPAVRVLFIGNSLTYYNGVPYLFSAATTELHKTRVSVDFLMQGGGHLNDVLKIEPIMNQLTDADYDVVVLQEQGGQLLCAVEEETRSSLPCIDSINAHRKLAEAASAEGATTVLLGTYQQNEQVARALVVGERWFFDALRFDRYVEVAPLLLNGQAEHPLLAWKAADGVHPGPALSMAIALATAEALFGPTVVDPDSISIRTTREKPTTPLTYSKIEDDLSVFYDDVDSSYPPEILRSVTQVLSHGI